VAAANADGAPLGGAILRKGGSKGSTHGVEQDRGAHEESVIEQLAQGQAVFKGDAPRIRVANIDHGRHDMFGLHAAFSNSLARDGNAPGSLWRGQHSRSRKAGGKLTVTGR